MPQFKKYKLGDITTWKSGGTPKKNIKNFWGGNIPWISAKNLTSSRISTSNIFITQEGLENGSRLAKVNSILLLVRGSGLYNGIPMGIVEKPVAFNQDIKSIEVDEKIINPWYLLYWLTGQKANLDSKLEETGIGAGKFDIDILKNLEIELPNIKHQMIIANIARCWDDKIELNRRTNQTLEQIAQILFKKYFVDDIDPENLPEGWRWGKLTELMDFLEGPGLRNWQYTEEGIRFMNIRLIEDGNINIAKANLVSEEEAFGKYKHFLLNAKDMVVSTSGTLGKSAIVRKNHLPLMLNTSVIRFRPIDFKSHAFIYQYLKSDIFLNELESKATGSVQLNFGPIHLKQIKLIIPPDNLIEEYCNVANELYDKITENLEENDVLTKIRDSLLPKFMSGEIEVKVAENSLTEQ